MKIYKIISLSVIILMCVVGIIVGLVAIGYYGYYGDYFTEQYYGADAFTDIQNALVDMNDNIIITHWEIEEAINISGWIIMIYFFIKLMNTIGKLIEAIKDCKDYYAQKKKEEIERRAAMYGSYQNSPVNPYPNYVPPQPNTFSNPYTDAPTSQNNTDMQ